MSKKKIKEAIEQTDRAQRKFGHQKSESILDDGKWVMWDDLIKEHQYDRCVMADNYELRKEYNSSKRSGTHQARGMTKERMFQHIARIPTWLWLRMEVQSGDPDFWNKKENYKEIKRLYPEYFLVDDI